MLLTESQFGVLGNSTEYETKQTGNGDPVLGTKPLDILGQVTFSQLQEKSNGKLFLKMFPRKLHEAVNVITKNEELLEGTGKKNQQTSNKNPYTSYIFTADPHSALLCCLLSPRWQ